MSEITKSRVPNFTSTEKCHLVRLIVNKYAAILEDKKTDRASVAQKDRAWVNIEADFNASSSSSTFRTAASLKKCYENRKKELRKSLAEERKEVLLTGGGPPPKIKKEVSDDLLLSIINKKTVIGLENPFDDDNDETPILMQENAEIEYILDRRENEPQMSTSRDIVEGEESIGSEALFHSWRKPTPKQLQEPIDSALLFSPNKEKTPKNSSRRRPTTTIKTMTSSDVAKKYDLLLDKRLALVQIQFNHAQEENALIIRKRQLEVEILETELKLKKRNLGGNNN